MRRLFRTISSNAGGILSVILALNIAPALADDPFAQLRWQTAAPVLLPRNVDGQSFHAVKDPSVVRYNGKWHLFCTVRGTKRSHAIVYLAFADWKVANKAQRHVLPMHGGYFCAPQVFYFRPQKTWYLICQAADAAWSPRYRPAFATTKNIADPKSWSKLKPLFGHKPAGAKAWLDFWVICDETRAYLFFTSLDGKMWWSATKLADFPHGWSPPVVALKGDVFEAAHTYRLKGRRKYLTLIEAQHGHGWRYYKAYTADKLDGQWKPLAATKDHAFASMRNVKQTGQRWTDCVSHGELLRAGFDERLEVEPAKLQFLIQGVLDSDRRGKMYGAIPWRLGILTPR
jgi:Glycosyl hydrolase family 62